MGRNEEDRIQILLKVLKFVDAVDVELVLLLLIPEKKS
jgi:hypothetical protein